MDGHPLSEILYILKLVLDVGYNTRRYFNLYKKRKNVKDTVSVNISKGASKITRKLQSDVSLGKG